MHLETWPTDGSVALPAEDHMPKFLSKTLSLLWISCVSETLRKLKERLFLLLFRFDTFFEKFNQHSTCAQALTLSHAPNLGSHLYGKCHALANSLVFGTHDTSMHHIGVSWSQ